MSARHTVAMREVVAIGAIALFAVAVTLVILISSSRAADSRRAASEQEERIKAAPEDFLLPELRTETREPELYPYRPRLPRWDREMVDTYWIPPRDIAVDILSRINDQNMERLFQNVP